MFCEQLIFNLDWRTRAKSLTTPILPGLPKPSKAIFRYALHGNDKSCKADFVRCEKCYVTVHRICYGNDVIKVTSWVCDRCQSVTYVSVSILFDYPK